MKFFNASPKATYISKSILNINQEFFYCVNLYLFHKIRWHITLFKNKMCWLSL